MKRLALLLVLLAPTPSLAAEVSDLEEVGGGAAAAAAIAAAGAALGRRRKTKRRERARAVVAADAARFAWNEKRQAQELEHMLRKPKKPRR